MFGLLEGVVAMLLVARLLEPPEGAVLGQTLWVTQLWFAGVILWGWDAFRRSDYRLRVGWIDAALWLVVAGHAISTAKVFFGGGDQRAALNLLWEWAGLGASFFLLRQVQRSREQAERLIRIMLALAVVLAGYGIWQHYVELPGVAEDYARIVRELQETNSPVQAGRLQRELADMGVPPNPASRSLWENRLKSTEPFATFALANTLAGFLAAWLFVAIEAIWVQTQGRVRSPWRLGGKVACLVLLGYCLVLTKSRTAWVGFAIGFLSWAAVRGAGAGRFSPGWLLAGAAGCLVIVAFFAVAGLSGGFDSQVISEAPKSLAYRLQYWAGSWEVVKDHPWLGTGPGNFRAHYLRHKLPESSEEIADPHNWVLDLWANGGLLALLGFLAILALAGRAGWRGLRKTSEGPTAPPATGLSAWEIGGGLAFLLVIAVGWFSGEAFEARSIWLLAGWGLAFGVLKQSENGLPTAGILAGGIAILVHLLGAGGIEMPAIVQTLLVFAVLLTAAAWEPAQETPIPIAAAPKGVLAASGLAAAAFGLCLATATGPVWQRTLYVAIGDTVFGRDFNPTAAAEWYQKADEADPYSPEPVQRLGELHFQRWRRNGSERDFDEAVRYGRLAIERDPASNLGYRQLGRWYLERAESRASAADAKTAGEFLSQAVERYPHSAPLRADLAQALDQSGQAEPAAAQARQALELNQINRDAGHIEKFLPEELQKTLKRIAGGG